MSPLYAASYYGHTLVARVLLMASKTTGGGRRRPQRTDVEAKSAEGFTPLLIAAQEGHLETVQVIQRTPCLCTRTKDVKLLFY